MGSRLTALSLRPLGVAVGLALASIAILCAAPASALPLCPERAALVYSQAPGVSHVGEGIELKMRSIDMARVAGLVVTVSSNGERRETPVSLVGNENNVVIVTSGAAKDLGATLDVTWDQDAGTPAACHGDRHYALPNVPAGATAGDPSRPRLKGRFAMRYTERGSPVTYDIWQMKPTCGYFACDARLGPPPYWGRLNLKPNGSYERNWERGPAATCTIDYFRNHRVVETREFRHSYYIHEHLLLRPVRIRGGLVVALAGRHRQTLVPTERARRRGCHRTYQWTANVKGRRIG